MNNKIVTSADGISLTILYVLGSNLILGKLGNKDAWLLLLVSVVLALPFLLMYTFIIPIEEKKTSTLKSLDNILGKIPSKIIKICYLYYFVMLSALVLRNYTEFISVVSLNKTPKLLIMFVVIILCYFGVRRGIGVVGKFASYSFLILTVLLGFTILLLIPQYNFDFIRPVFPIDKQIAVMSIMDDVTFPLLESIAFIFVLDNMMHKEKSRKVLLIGVSLGGAILAFYILVSMLVLGELTYSSTYFPIYRAMSRVDILEFIQRLEIIPATAFMLAGYFKISICLYVSLLLIQDVFNIKSYRSIMTPTAICIVLLCYIIFEGVIEMVQWAVQTYWLYALPFQVFIPIIILVVKIIRNKIKSTKSG